MFANRTLICLVAALVLAGCDKLSFQNRYQLVAASDGRILRIDTLGGDVFLVEKDVLNRIPEDSKLALSIGRIYKFEDNRWMKYTGNGQFEPAQKVINWKDFPKQ